MLQAAATPISGRLHAHRAARRGWRLFSAYGPWIDGVLRHRADGFRLLNSPLLGLPGVQRLAHRRYRCSAFAAVHATRDLLQQASAIMTPRQAVVLQLIGEESPMAAIGARLGLRSRQHLWAAYRRPAVEAETREILTLAQAEFPPNWDRISMPLFLEGGNGL